MLRGLTILAAAVVFAMSAMAQTATGVLQGRVTDATGAIVPQTKVTVQNEATGVALSVVSNAEGNFQRSYLLPGNYQVTVVGDRINMYLNTSVFSQTPNFTWGNASRTSPDVRGPSFHGFDASIFKNFRIRERGQVQFRTEAFNFFNHPVWGGPNTTVNAVGANGFGTITTKNGNRTLHLVLRVSF